MLKQKLQEELKTSMLAKDKLKTSVLRLLLSATNYYEIQKGLPRRVKAGGAGYQATDEDILSVIQREAKQRKDSIEQFSAAGRKDLADKEKKELELLQKYLPKQMSEEEIRNLVKEAISQANAVSPTDMGKVMGALMPKVKGKAEGTLVGKIVKEELSSTS